jgi:sialidase-1
MKASPLFEECTLWHRHDDGAFCRAIPSINVTGKGELISFSEARLHAPGTVEDHLMYDEIPSHLIYKRSTDMGGTWSESMFFERADGAWWKHQGREKLESWSQATSVVNVRTGQIFVFYILNEGEHKGANRQRFSRVFLRTSEDEGVSWSNRIELTDVLNCHEDYSRGPAGSSSEGFAADYLGRAFHICIGHGIQLASGRLLVPFWSRRTVAHPPDERLYGLTPIASDDDGASWNVCTHLGLRQYLTEHRLVELGDGSLYMNCRTDRPDICDFRMSSRSIDGGETWTEPTIDRAFGRSYRCDAGLAYSSGNLVIAKGSAVENRSRMTVFLSRDDGVSWCARKVVYEGGAFYSDLVALPDGNFGLVYLKHRLNQWRGRDVVFAKFNASWIET